VTPARPRPEPLEVGARPTLRGETLGDGPPVVLVHGITATRRYVVHGSAVLPRKGFRIVAYDARGHGNSDPAPPGSGYKYPELIEDLGALVDAVAPEERVVLAGHSMGAHTIVALALAKPDRLAGIVLIGPSYIGVFDDRVLARWGELADALAEGGVDGFMRAYEAQGIPERWRQSILRFTRERLEAHRHPEAVAQALREVPPSRPFETLDELEFCQLPALVVASHDDADPGHPYTVAEAYADRLPHGRLVSEEPGQSPLAWQGGRLSREIAGFCATEAVAQRLE
jgi:pimeloyl-ACP methyl ester carboxylesterase